MKKIKSFLAILAITTLATPNLFADTFTYNKIEEKSEIIKEIDYVKEQQATIKLDDDKLRERELSIIEELSITAYATLREVEPNNSMGTADSIQSDDNMYGKISSSTDIDFYKVTFKGKGTANFFLGSIPSGCDYDLELLNSSGRVVDSSKRSGNRDELISDYPVSNGETYYLKVYSYSGSSNSEYLLRVKLYEELLVEWPVPASTRITQRYSSGHKAIDIGAKSAGVAGDRIVAATDGYVIRAGWSDSYGWVVYLISANKIDGDYIKTIYAHMENSPSVDANTNITMGRTLGYMGNTGVSQGVHLHFETMTFANQDKTANKGTYVNPLNYYPDLARAVFIEEGLQDNSLEQEETFFYSMDEIKAMTQEERDQLGIPYYE